MTLRLELIEPPCGLDSMLKFRLGLALCQGKSHLMPPKLWSQILGAKKCNADSVLHPQSTHCDSCPI